jgi:hypothetical protein
MDVFMLNFDQDIDREPFPVTYTGGTIAAYPLGPEESLPKKVSEDASTIIHQMMVEAELRRRMPIGRFDPGLEAQIRGEIPRPRIGEAEARDRFQGAVADWAQSNIGLRPDAPLQGMHAHNGSIFSSFLSHLRELPETAGSVIAYSDIDPDMSKEFVGTLANKLIGALREGNTLAYAPVHYTSNGFVSLPLAEGVDLAARNLATEGTPEWREQVGQLVISIFFEGHLLEVNPETETLYIVQLPDNKDRATRILLPRILREKIAHCEEAIARNIQQFAAGLADISAEMLEATSQGYLAAIRHYQRVIEMMEQEFDQIEFAGWRKKHLDDAIAVTFNEMEQGQELTPDQVREAANRVLDALSYDILTNQRVNFYMGHRAPSQPAWSHQLAKQLIKEVITQVDTSSEMNRIALMTVVYATLERAEMIENAALMGRSYTVSPPPRHMITVQAFGPLIPNPIPHAADEPDAAAAAAADEIYQIGVA